MNPSAPIRKPNQWVWALGTGAVWWAAATVALVVLTSTVAPWLGCIFGLAQLVCFGVGAHRGWNQAGQQDQQIKSVLAQNRAGCAPVEGHAKQKQVEECRTERDQQQAAKKEAKFANRMHQKSEMSSFAESVKDSRTFAADIKGL